MNKIISQNRYLSVNINIFYNLEKKLIFLRKINVKSFSFLFFAKNYKYFNKEFNSKFIYLCNKYFYKRSKIIPHSSFYINLGHYSNKKLYRNIFFFIQEIKLCYNLGLKYINFHPGYHLNVISNKDCLNRIGNSINYILTKTKKIILLIENSSGHGSSVCSSFEEIAYLINLINDKSRIGVCFDVCHAFSYGYDLRDIYLCENLFINFNKIINLKYLKAIHLSDSENIYLSKKDRHSSLRKGNLGENIFRYIMNSNIFYNMSIVLETRNMFLWKKEIVWLNSLKN